MSILVRRYLGRSRCLEELLEDWQIRYQKAQLAWDVQDLVSECIELGQLAQRAWDFVADKLYDENHRFDHEKVGEAMGLALQKTLHAFNKVDEDVIETVDRLDCPPVDNVPQFKRSLVAVRRIAKEFKEQWPSIDRETVKEALAAYQRGEFQTSGALLDETRSKDTQAG
jgi:hypothetical protein